MPNSSYVTTSEDEMNRKTVLTIAAVLLVMTAANVAYVQSLPTTREIKVDAFDFYFTVPGLKGNNPTITVRTGDTIVLTLENVGTKDDHEFFILTQSDFSKYTAALENGQNASEPEPAFTNGSVEDVPAGQSKTGTFVVGLAGTYVYACLDKQSTDPLTHADKGMYGTLEVQSAGLFGVTRSLGDTITSLFGTVLVSMPAIVIWQLALVALLVLVTKRQ